MSLRFTVSDRLYEAAEEWADARFEEIDDALATKVEQSLLEIEHLVSGGHEVAFEIEGRDIVFDPSDETAGFLETQADRAGIDAETVLKLHVDLYANTFLKEAKDQERPPGTPKE
ncbi:hypothetical protein [Halosegnis sp.]|uniref:hypothetical protein n=1 Tax=Halosegnis sp. TaxID=2864959 RepID=UPI0035D4B13F